MPSSSKHDTTTTPARSAHRRRRRHGKDRYVDVLADDREAVQPNLTQLRQLREAYFGGRSGRHVPTKRARSRVVTNKSRSIHEAARSKPEETVTTRRRVDKQCKTQHDRTAEYVYRDVEPSRNPRRRRSKRPTSSREIETSQSSRSSSPELLREEVTPEDSVSQVGGRTSRHHKALRRGTLRPIKEQSVARTAAISAADRGARSSGFWGSIFARQPEAKAAAPKLFECLTCGTEDLPAARVAKLDCGHNMCHPCLKRVFKLAVHDPAHMPPKCCTSEPIPLKHVGALFDVRFKVLFNKKLDEYNTKNRVYCPNKRCGVWIRPSSYATAAGRKYAHCPKCSTKACIHCSQKLHKSLDCPKDPEIAKLIAEAEQRGWKRCFSCNAMVELKEGCNHITCRCTAEFCYVCGAKWKSCDCPWFNNTNARPLDGLDDMVFPQPLNDVLQRVRAAYQDFVAQPAVPQEETPGPAAARPRQRGYRAEVERRRRQEADDAELAHRLQFVAFD